MQNSTTVLPSALANVLSVGVLTRYKGDLYPGDDVRTRMMWFEAVGGASEGGGIKGIGRF